MTGVPRVDAILKMNRARCRRRFFAAYPELRGQKIVLYAPTFRDGEQMPEIAHRNSAQICSGCRPLAARISNSCKFSGIF